MKSYVKSEDEYWAQQGLIIEQLDVDLWMVDWGRGPEESDLTSDCWIFFKSEENLPLFTIDKKAKK